MHQAYNHYKSGGISIEEALRWLTSTLDETSVEVAACREAISMIVAEQPDQRVDIPGLPVMMITAPGTEYSITYDNKAIEELRIKLTKTRSHMFKSILKMIEDARKVNPPKSGSLRITNRKQRKG